MGDIQKNEDDILYIESFLPNYQNIEFQDDIINLLKNNSFLLAQLKTDELVYLWENYSEGKNLIINFIDIIVSNHDYAKLKTIISLSMSAKEDFLDIYTQMAENVDISKRVLLIDVLLDLGFPATEELIIGTLRKDKGNQNNKKLEKNHIFDILEYRMDDTELQTIFLSHFEELFDSAIHEKMQILSLGLELDSNLSTEIVDKYEILVSYYNQIPSENQKWADEIISDIINNNSEEKLLLDIKERLKSEKLTLKESGSYSIVLGTKEWVLKLCRERITWNSPRKSFLLNASEFETILDNNGIPIAGIEWQEFLPITDKKITKDLIYKYLVEFRNQNLTIADSTILAYNQQNFRFLKDTSMVKKEYQDIPEWFLENPVVSIDIDAIYERGENEEADRAMDEAISRHGK